MIPQPCPFCGGVDVILRWEVPLPGHSHGSFSMCCLGCGARGPQMVGSDLPANIVYARGAWNKRASAVTPPPVSH